MITLSLLHPIKQIPVQVWTFPNESTIRIGRSTDNQVILYSAVVSRHHVELRRVGADWEVVNLGTNGTYLDGKRITQVPVVDGAIIRLARSGPNIQIRIGSEALKDAQKTTEGERTVGQRLDHPPIATEVTHQHLHKEDGDDSEEEDTASPTGTIPVPPHLQLSSEAVTGLPVFNSVTETNSSTAVAIKPIGTQPAVLPTTIACRHPRGGALFCVDCGQPLQPLQTVGDCQLVKVLGQGEIGMTYLAWRAGQQLALKTLNSNWVTNPKAQAALECEAEVLRHLNHLRIPHLIDFFLVGEQPYLAMEMMVGQSLAQRIAVEGPVSLERAIAWMIEVCRVLEYLHSFTPPVLHRGIKPASLIRQPALGSSDAIALVDFGAIKALVLGQDALAIATGYNAPEQLKMDVTPAVDLFALGPLLAYLVTGQSPVSFYGELGQGYRFYAEMVPGVTPEVSQVMRTLTHPLVEQRYSSVSAVVEALQGLEVKS